ncbi:glycosyltransferase family 4 protein [Vibrio alginolyticus]|uniref:glycosyltransferase family 4 protein n=1 Tax=Vibrio alginolyticus TaxID=663 RepID=UPI001BD68BDF|nr:glycosyltransferase family 4 protein [Vibrio alginolyticus]EHA1076445.1 glycosyltransferase family 4 protein [Vibrio alginolyticus]EHA1135915.1 glycosyltransferase family 4 protein [Vibrio alginolyticus]EIK0772197.1 glycosyltransferase family 4 protein [Vibrio alginolyticus]MBS9979019.1 glycosyltransferase family 4 protein [Vibrio alginolyticus]MCR9313181.1 glycosyltransferase family 4 protein [Vibrio alginolyticus]
MKKLLFIDSYYTGLNGAPTSMLSLALGLKLNGHSVTISSTKFDGLLTKAEGLDLNAKSLNTPTVLLRSRKDFSLSNKIIYMFVLLYYWIFQLIKINFNKFDTICINDIRSFLLLFPILLLNKNKIIWYVRINERIKIISSLAAFLSKEIILISSDCIDVLSHAERNKYSKKISILHTGFNFNEVCKEKVIEIEKSIPNKNGKVYVTVGSICPRKNQMEIIQSFNEACGNDDLLLLIGSVTSNEDLIYENEINSKISELNLENQIIRVPHTPYVHEYLSISDIFLFASHKEGLPRVAIEALHSGCFVCSSLVDGIRDIIDDSNKGLVTSVKSNDPLFHLEFVNKILSIDKSQLSERGLRKKYISKKFGYNDFISGFEKIAFNKDV